MDTQLLWGDLLAALALMMVFEGVLPFLSPRQWRRMMFSVMQLDTRALRIGGAVSMAAGLLFLYWVRG